MTVPTQSCRSTTTIDSFIRYLEAKRTVDDRALNALVWQTLVNELPTVTTERPLRVLEVGVGIGTMVERLVEQQMFGHTEYTALDEIPLSRLMRIISICRVKARESKFSKRKVI